MLLTIQRWLKYDDYRNLLKNVSSLGLVQLSNYILPLITLPYLTRVLGVTNFGLVMMAQAVMVYLTLMTDYGFNLSATKEIANNRHSLDKVSEITSSVLTIKLGVLMVSFGVLYTLVQIVPVFKAHQLLLYLSFLIVIGNTFFPTFLFQGLEKMTFIASFNFIAKLGFTGLIFLLITSVNDYAYVHALWGGSYIFIDCVAAFIIIYQLKLHMKWPSVQLIKRYLSLSLEYFLSRISIAIYLNANIIIVGLLFSPAQAGFYSTAEKLLFAITTMYVPLIETVYPYVSRSKNVSFIRKVLVITTGLNGLLCVVAFFISPILIPLIFGGDFKAAIPLFQWMLVFALIHLPASMIGYPVLAALGFEKIANRSLIVGAIIHIVLIGCFFQFITSPIHMIWIMIISQLMILIIRVTPMMSKKLLKS